MHLICSFKSLPWLLGDEMYDLDRISFSHCTLVVNRAVRSLSDMDFASTYSQVQLMIPYMDA